MKPVELASIFVRLFAISIVLSSLTLILRVFEIAHQWRTNLYTAGGLQSPSILEIWLIVVLVAFALSLLVAGILIWRSPFALARAIVPKGVEAELSIGINAEQLEVLAMSVLGLWVLVDAVPALIYLIVNSAVAWNTHTETEGQLANYVYRLVQIGIGGFLSFQSVGIRRVINQLRQRAPEAGVGD